MTIKTKPRNTSHDTIIEILPAFYADEEDVIDVYIMSYLDNGECLENVAFAVDIPEAKQIIVALKETIKKLEKANNEN